MNSEQLWQATLGELELKISKVHFTTWFRSTFILEWNGDAVVVAVPNNFTKAWLESKYHKAISDTMRSITEQSVQRISYKVESARKVDAVSARVEETAPETAESIAHDMAMPAIDRPAGNTAEQRSVAYGLNPRHLFKNFIVGKGSELAYAAAMRVAKEPGTKYNPLFLYGGVGLGKTHLMHAVGNEALHINPSARLLYVSSEKFTNDYIGALQAGIIESFKQKYRTVDILLVDDIQFIAGKEQTQEQFFHVFNSLRDAHKQIILTSDRPPKAIPALEERLISRFEWGMIADIASPDMETRIAILKSKSLERGQEIGEELLRYIAINVQSNVRELEGALNKMLAHSELHNTAPTLDMAKDVISSITVSQKRGGITVREMIKIVAEYFDIAIEDLTGQSRRRELVVPRQITMFLMREELDASYPTIGQELGGRDHTTAMHAYAKIKRDFDNDDRVRQDIHSIKQRLYNG